MNWKVMAATFFVAAALSCRHFRRMPKDTDRCRLAQSRVDGSLVLYSEDQFQGSAAPFEGEQSNLSDSGWNNQAESLSIREGDIWEVCGETEFRDCKRIDSNVPDLGKLGLNKKISSIRPIQQIDPTLIKPLEGRTAGFFPTPRRNDAPIPACADRRHRQEMRAEGSQHVLRGERLQGQRLLREQRGRPRRSPLQALGDRSRGGRVTAPAANRRGLGRGWQCLPPTARP